MTVVTHLLVDIHPSIISWEIYYTLLFWYDIPFFFYVKIILTFLKKVPYESWKTTHRIHHKNTGNIDKDEIFYPHRENSLLNLSKRYIAGSLSVAWYVFLKK